MKCNIHINGKDALANWGVTLADGSVNALLLPSQSKDRVTNESRLRDGKDVLAGRVPVKDRDLSLTFNVYADDIVDFYNKINSFIDELMKGTAHVEISYLPDITFRLDYISSSQLSQLRGELGKIVVKFNESNPTNR